MRSDASDGYFSSSDTDTCAVATERGEDAVLGLAATVNASVPAAL
jgi:hypothetical protein